MTSAPSGNDREALAADADSLRRATTTAHRSVLVLIAACALAILWLGSETTDAFPRPYTYAAIALSVTTVAARRFSTSPVLNLRARLLWAMASLGCAAGLGLVAAAIGIDHGDQQAGLLIAVGAGILVIRPPEAAALPPATGTGAGTGTGS